MNSAVIFALVSAFFSGGLAFWAAWNARQSVSQWALAAGMLVLMIESVFLGLTAYALVPEEMVRWQNYQLLAKSFVPGIWLFFSLSYSR